MDEKISSEKLENNVMCAIDGDDGIPAALPFNQCKIITDNFKKTFKPK